MDVLMLSRLQILLVDLATPAVGEDTSRFVAMTLLMERAVWSFCVCVAKKISTR